MLAVFQVMWKKYQHFTPHIMFFRLHNPKTEELLLSPSCGKKASTVKS